MPRKSREEKNAYARAYYWAHREEQREKNRAYHAAHKEHLQAYARDYRKEYHVTHQDEIKEYSKKHGRTDEGRFSNLRKSAKQRKLELTLTFDEFCGLISQPCFYCKGLLPEAGSGVDRINSSIGYILENCRPCCTNCNLAKSDMTEDEFRKWIMKVYHSWADNPLAVKV